jgi:hypothetical protein
MWTYVISETTVSDTAFEIVKLCTSNHSSSICIRAQVLALILEVLDASSVQYLVEELLDPAYQEVIEVHFKIISIAFIFCCKAVPKYFHLLIDPGH